MTIIIGSDHRGFSLKEELINYLKEAGYEVVDVGPHGSDSVDYPLYAQKVAVAVEHNDSSKGILICGSGTGMCIAANKFNGIRAATVRDQESAEMSVKHNNANIICLGADFISVEQAKNIIDRFMNTDFEGGRHQRRIDMIKELEIRIEE